MNLARKLIVDKRQVVALRGADARGRNWALRARNSPLAQLWSHWLADVIIRSARRAFKESSIAPRKHL